MEETIRWNFLKGCKHDLDGDNKCPMCTLVENSTRKFLLEEAAQIEISRRSGYLIRAQTRFSMLDGWSRNQGSIAGENFIGTMVDVYLNGPLLDAILYYSGQPVEKLPSTEFVLKSLKRRRKLMQVGDYASTFLQCRIRRVCCKKRVRKYFLKRFEWNYADKYRKEHYIDKKTGRKWAHQPRILNGERAGSPRTIHRRITAEELRGSIRENTAKEIIKLSARELKHGDVWTKESEEIINAQRFAIFRDVLKISAHVVHDKRDKEEDEVPVPVHVPVPSETALDGVPSPSDMPVEEKEIEEVYNPNKLPSPVWISCSAPAPSARALGISLVLEYQPRLERLIEVHEDDFQSVPMPDLTNDQSQPTTALGRKRGMTADDGTKTRGRTASGASAGGLRGASRDASSQRGETPATAGATQSRGTRGTTRGGADGGTPATAATATIVHTPTYLSVNECLLQLEQRAWDALKCDTIDDILSIVRCEELAAPLQSILNIADDDLHVWDSDLCTKRSVKEMKELEKEEMVRLAAIAENEARLATAARKKQDDKDMDKFRKARRKKGQYDSSDSESSNSDSDSSDSSEGSGDEDAKFLEKIRKEKMSRTGAAPIIEEVEEDEPVVLVDVPPAPPPPPSRVFIARRLTKLVIKSTDLRKTLVCSLHPPSKESSRLPSIVKSGRRANLGVASKAVVVAARTAKEEEEKMLIDAEEEAKRVRMEKLVTLNTAGQKKHDSTEVVPFSLHIRPSYKKTSMFARDCFRMFFMDGELVGVCQLSPWAFHGEMIRSKDLVVAALTKYAQSSGELRRLLKSVSKNANNVNNSSRAPTAEGLQSSASRLPGAASRGSCSNLFVPSEKFVFPSPLCETSKVPAILPDPLVKKTESFVVGAEPPKGVPSEDTLFAQSPVTPQVHMGTDEMLKLNSEYKFLSKLSVWKAFMKLANTSNITKSKRGVADKKLAAQNKRNAAIAAKKGLPPPEAEVAAVATKVPMREPSMDISKPIVDLSDSHVAAVTMAHVNQIIQSSDVSLEGQSIFECACLNLPGIEAKAQPDKDDYDTNLKNMMTMTDNMMTSRIDPVEGTQEHIRPHFDLIAIEVTLDLSALYAIPYVEPEPHVKTSSNKQRESNVGTSGKKKKTPVTPQIKLPKSLPSPVFHQLVGIFTTSAERPPPALDLGLFEWSYFVNIARIIDGFDGSDDISVVTAKTSTTLLGESGTLPSVGSPGGSENLSTTSRFHGPKWHPVDSESGELVYVNQTGCGRPSQFRFIGKEPSKDYLNREIPRKIRVWLGI